MDFFTGFTDELVKLADGEHQGKFRKFVNSEAGAMYASHLPGGGAMLGALRDDKGGNWKSKLKSAGKGMAGEALGNAVGGTAGLGAGLLAKHVLTSRGINAPGWLVPTATAVGGLAVGPALMHKFTHQ
jgi:hypothetical protein